MLRTFNITILVALGYITYLCLALLLTHTTHTMIAMMIINPPIAAPIMISIGSSSTSKSTKLIIAS